MKSLSKNSQDEKIVLQTQIEYAYKIFRLIIYAVVVTYFIGCFWYMIVQFTMESSLDQKEIKEINFITVNKLHSDLI